MVSIRVTLPVTYILQTGQKRPKNEENWPPLKTLKTNASFKYMGNHFSTQPLIAWQNNYTNDILFLQIQS